MVSSAKSQVLARTSIVPKQDGQGHGQLDRFCLPYRQTVRGLAEASPALADLVTSFPGLAFALATSYGSRAARERCLELIGQGAPLREAAEALGLPWWLRRVPPEAFNAPLGALPLGAEFGRRIVNHVPLESWRMATWFNRVQAAYGLAGEEFALWIAWRTKAAPRMRDLNRLVLLSAWAWFSRHPEQFGASLLRQPFEASLSLRKAMEEADAWKKRIDLAVAIGEGIKDTWYPASSAGGYDFVPLASLADFLGEAERMENCLDQYGSQVGQQTTRVFSIRQAGAPVADLEIGPHEDDATMPAIVQLRGPANRRVGPEVWRAAFTWLGQQNGRAIGGGRAARGVAARQVARRIWGPHLESVAGRPHEPLLRTFLRSGEVHDPEL